LSNTQRMCAAGGQASMTLASPWRSSREFRCSQSWKSMTSWPRLRAPTFRLTRVPR